MDAVPTGFVVNLVAMTLLALAAWLAPARPAWVTYLLTVTVNELPLIVALLVGQSAWFAVTGEGLLETTAGRILFAFAVAVELLVLWLLLRGIRARKAVGLALAETFGGRPRPAHTRSVPRTLLTPYPLRPRAVQRIGNLSYGPDPRYHRLDVYRHRAMPPDAPVLAWFHGGGYFSGSKRYSAKALLYHFAAQGWLVISADYRLRPAARWPDQLVDAKRLLAWLREHAAGFGADATTVVLAGGSAGAHLSAVTALTANNPAYQPGFEATDTGVTAAVCLYGYYGDPSSPARLDATGAPPFFIAHGDHDTITPVSGARALRDRLRAQSASPVVLVELPGGQHGFDLFRSPRYDAVIAGVEAFATRTLGQPPDLSRRR